MSYRRLVSGAFLILFFVAFALSGASVQAPQAKQEEQPLFLVARRDTSDPFFQDSVVAMLPLPDAPLIIGLIINKPTVIPLRKVFPGDEALKDRSETVYFGEPVDLHTPGVVFRSTKSNKQATHLFGDFYVSFDGRFIKDMLDKPKPARDLRPFLGRSQWAPRQLQNEMLRGGWYPMRAEPDLILNPKPETVWPMLLQRVDAGNVA